MSVLPSCIPTLLSMGGFFEPSAAVEPTASSPLAQPSEPPTAINSASLTTRPSLASAAIKSTASTSPRSSPSLPSHTSAARTSPASTTQTTVLSLTAPTSPAAAMSFNEHVQNLPPEIFDRIFDLTMVIEPVSVYICRTYSPPVQLQIAQRSRAVAAKKFYGDGDSALRPRDDFEHKFYFGVHTCSQLFHGRMTSLAPEHRKLLPGVTMDFRYVKNEIDLEFEDMMKPVLARMSYRQAEGIRWGMIETGKPLRRSPEFYFTAAHLINGKSWKWSEKDH